MRNLIEIINVQHEGRYEHFSQFYVKLTILLLNKKSPNKAPCFITYFAYP
jgi:hypothetical protein